jgi:tRNA A-37 threonylcarbamoyl transferase component Bud32
MRLRAGHGTKPRAPEREIRWRLELWASFCANVITRLERVITIVGTLRANMRGRARRLGFRHGARRFAPCRCRFPAAGFRAREGALPDDDGFMTGPDRQAPALAGLPEAWKDRLEATLARKSAAPERVQRLDLDGTTLWLKRPERLHSLRWRVQKGDPRRAFLADLAGLRFLAEHGVPAPAVVYSGPDCFVTEDAGVPLDALLHKATGTEGARMTAAAASSLAKLHHTGARHGRPKLRDICWDGRTARLIDLERFRSRASAQAMGLDWAILLHSLLETSPGAGSAFTTAVRTYRAAAPAAAVAAGAGLIRRLGWTEPLLRLALRLWPDHREFAAAAQLPRAFADA